MLIDPDFLTNDEVSENSNCQLGDKPKFGIFAKITVKKDEFDKIKRKGRFQVLAENTQDCLSTGKIILLLQPSGEPLALFEIEKLFYRKVRRLQRVLLETFEIPKINSDNFENRVFVAEGRPVKREDLPKTLRIEIEKSESKERDKTEHESKEKNAMEKAN